MIGRWVKGFRTSSVRYVRQSTLHSQGNLSDLPKFREDQVKHDEDEPSETEKEGIRQILKKMTPDPKILQHLDEHNLGYLTTRRSRVKVAKKFDFQESQNNTVSKVRKVYNREEAPFPFDKVGKRLFSLKEVDYHQMNFETYPPQVALIGRSNAGKSTLINALVGFDKSYVQKAIVSHRPGETRELTFYQMGRVRNPHYGPLAPNESEPLSNSAHLSHIPGLILVDMPGYGFAFMNETEQKRCHQLYMEYLFDSQFLAHCPVERVLVLLDARHGLKKTDLDFLQLLDRTYRQYRERYLSKTAKEKISAEIQALKASTSPLQEVKGSHTTSDLSHTTSPPPPTSILRDHYPKHLSWKLQFVLTKCDLVERIELCKRIQYLKIQLNQELSSYFFNDLPILTVSGKDYTGLVEIQKELSNLIKHPIVKEFKARLQVQREKQQSYAFRRRQQEKQLQMVEEKKSNKSIDKYQKKSKSSGDRKVSDDKRGNRGDRGESGQKRKREREMSRSEERKDVVKERERLSAKKGKEEVKSKGKSTMGLTSADFQGMNENDYETQLIRQFQKHQKQSAQSTDDKQSDGKTSKLPSHSEQVVEEVERETGGRGRRRVSSVRFRK